MAARQEQIQQFTTNDEKGSATLCIYHLAAGDGTCDSTAIEGIQKRSLASIVNELTGLGVLVDSGPVLKTLGEIETQQRRDSGEYSRRRNASLSRRVADSKTRFVA
jgi:hypothetical protein